MAEVDWSVVTNVVLLVVVAFLAGGLHGQQKRIDLWQERTELLGRLLMDTLDKLDMVPDEVKRGMSRS